MSSAGSAFTDYQNEKADSQIFFIKFTLILISFIYIVSFILPFTPFSIDVPVLSTGGLVSAPIRIVLLIVLIVGNALLLKSKIILDNLNSTSNKEDSEKAIKDSNKYATWGYILNILGIAASTYLMFN
jgi:hypothetical protein